MVNNFLKYDRFQLPDGSVLAVESVTYNSKSIVLRVGDHALLVRPAQSFDENSFDKELNRRRHAVCYAYQHLKEYVQKTEFVDLEGIQIKGGKIIKIPLIARKVKWLDEIHSLRDLRFREVISDKELCTASIKISLFVLYTAILRGMLYDIFQMFDDMSIRSRNVMDLLSPNIMIGIDTFGRRSVYIDADWYLRITDGKYTGFPLYQYIKRFTQGPILLAVTIVVFSFAYCSKYLFKHSN